MKDWEPYKAKPERPAWLNAVGIGILMIGALGGLLFYILQP